jgi:anti-sigma regulatory factor (Ser/Thr protein kinase)
MEGRPPYLFGSTGSSGRAPSLTLTSDVETAVVEMAVHGRWSQRLGMDVSSGVRKCLAEHPSAVIADLHDMGDPDGASVALWIAGRRAATALQPPVQLVLCVPPEAPLAHRLQRVGAGGYLPVFPTMCAARAAVGSRLPLTDLLQLTLPPDLLSASLARNLVGEACQAWDLVELLHPARLVMSELVVNAAEHAGTDMIATVSRRGAGLHLSVRDGEPTLPQLRSLAPVVAGMPLDERGQGLHLVHAASAAWGAMPTQDGKVVWATMHPHRSKSR